MNDISTEEKTTSYAWTLMYNLLPASLKTYDIQAYQGILKYTKCIGLDYTKIFLHSNYQACKVKGYLEIQRQNVIIILRGQAEIIHSPYEGELGRELLKVFRNSKSDKTEEKGYIKWKI